METGLCEKFGKQGLTFDDVLLIPAESDGTPNISPGVPNFSHSPGSRE